MKFPRLFKRKKKEPAPPEPSEQPAMESDFYSRRVADDPLGSESSGPMMPTTRRTSRHSPVVRRENSNRASNWALGMLLLRAVLLVVLLGGGFVALRMVLTRLAEPGEEEKQRWEERALLMDQGGKVNLPDRPVSPVLSAKAPRSASLTERLESWEDAERHLRSADALIRRGIDLEAAHRLHQALAAAPENRNAMRRLMEIYVESGQYDQALPLCMRLLEQDSAQREVKMHLLAALYHTGRYEDALALSSQMLQRTPGDLEVLMLAARSSRAAADNARALDLYDRILQRRPAHIGALQGSAEILLEQERFEDALPFYTELLRQEPSEPVYYALALCYAQTEEVGKAVIRMGQAASLFGESTVGPWLAQPAFNPIRETVDFRSFADRIIGIESRKAIEAINRREQQRDLPDQPIEPVLPDQPSLKAVDPGR